MIHPKITKAKVSLIISQPFFATLALGMKYIECNTIKTADTDGKCIRYNPKFVDELTQDQVTGLIAHEVLHPGFLHHTRRNGRDPKKWNRACDYPINHILKESGFALPDGGLINPKFSGLSAEEIYNLLPDDPKDKDKDSGNDPGGCGGVEDSPAQTQSEAIQIEAEQKQLMIQAATIAKQQGKLPAHLQRLVDEVLQPVINWRDVLNTFLTEKTRNDYTWSKPSKRFLSMGLYLPTLESIDRGEFVLMVDTSGSIDQNLLNEFAGEMQSILSESAKKLTVIYVDTEVNEVQEFECDDEVKLNPIGGGGTDFKPGFDYLDENGLQPAAIVYFTDGYCSSFPVQSDYPVLWATYENKSFAPPFGEVIHVK